MKTLTFTGEIDHIFLDQNVIFLKIKIDFGKVCVIVESAVLTFVLKNVFRIVKKYWIFTNIENSKRPLEVQKSDNFIKN